MPKELRVVILNFGGNSKSVCCYQLLTTVCWGRWRCVRVCVFMFSCVYRVCATSSGWGKEWGGKKQYTDHEWMRHAQSGWHTSKICHSQLMQHCLSWHN